MQECRMIYRCDDNFVGNVHEVANHLGISVANVYRAVYYGRIMNGQHIKFEKENIKKYMVVDRGGIVEFVGTAKEIAEKYYISIETVYVTYYEKRRMLGEYEVKKVEQ